MIVEALEPEKYFHTIWDGLQEAMSHSGGYVTIGQILDQVRHGNWKLFMVLEDNGDYVGFGIVEPLSLANGLWLNVPFAYARNGLYQEFFSHMKEIAYKTGMSGIKFVSGRPGFEKVAEKYGWKKGFTEWIVEDFRNSSV